MQIRDLMGEMERRRDAEPPYVIVRKPGTSIKLARIEPDAVPSTDDFVAKVRSEIGAGLYEFEFYGPSDPCAGRTCSDPSPYDHAVRCLGTIRMTIPAIPTPAAAHAE